MAASVWMKFSKVATPSCARPVALTMPWVTVCDSPSGLPIASTTSPTCSRSERPRVMTGRSRQVDLQHREVGVRVAAHDLDPGNAAVGQLHADLVEVGDNVLVGDDVTLAVDDDARTEAGLHPLPKARLDRPTQQLLKPDSGHALGYGALGIDVDHRRRAGTHRVGEAAAGRALQRRRRQRSGCGARRCGRGRRRHGSWLDSRHLGDAEPRRPEDGSVAARGRRPARPARDLRESIPPGKPRCV